MSMSDDGEDTLDAEYDPGTDEFDPGGAERLDGQLPEDDDNGD